MKFLYTVQSLKKIYSIYTQLRFKIYQKRIFKKGLFSKNNFEWNKWNFDLISIKISTEVRNIKEIFIEVYHYSCI